MGTMGLNGDEVKPEAWPEIRKPTFDEIIGLVYQGAVKECEAREHSGSLHGNGHHMAQKIAEDVKELLKQRFPDFYKTMV